MEKTNKRKEILITGGLGFIGSTLARKYANEGHKVTIVSRSDKKKTNISDIEKEVTITLKDIRDIGMDDVAGKDYIFHFAGTVDNYAVKEGNPYEDININCTGTVALLEACKNYNKEARIMLASTFFVNGNPTKLPVTPESPCNPLALYPATKLAAEHFFHIYNKVSGLDTLVARFTNVFGPYEQGDNRKKAGFNFLINQALRGEEIQLYNNGDFVRDYIYVDDVVDACRVIAEKGKTNETYYIGRGEFIKFRKLIDIIASIIPDTKVIGVNPPEFHKAVGIANFVADVSPIKELGWAPKVSLEEGILRTINFYRSAQKRL